MYIYVCNYFFWNTLWKWVIYNNVLNIICLRDAVIYVWVSGKILTIVFLMTANWFSRFTYDLLMSPHKNALNLRSAYYLHKSCRYEQFYSNSKAKSIDKLIAIYNYALASTKLTRHHNMNRMIFRTFSMLTISYNNMVISNSRNRLQIWNFRKLS